MSRCKTRIDDDRLRPCLHARRFLVIWVRDGRRFCMRLILSSRLLTMVRSSKRNPTDDHDHVDVVPSVESQLPEDDGDESVHEVPRIR